MLQHDKLQTLPKQKTVVTHFPGSPPSAYPTRQLSAQNGTSLGVDLIWVIGGKSSTRTSYRGSLEVAAPLYYFLHFPSLNSSEQPCSEQPLSLTDGTSLASEANHFVNRFDPDFNLSFTSTEASKGRKKDKKAARLSSNVSV